MNALRSTNQAPGFRIIDVDYPLIMFLSFSLVHSLCIHKWETLESNSEIPWPRVLREGSVV